MCVTTMTSLTALSFPSHTKLHPNQPIIRASSSSPPPRERERGQRSKRELLSTILTASVAVVGLQATATTPLALAENWGTRSFILEKFFQPGLSPEDAVARIKQTSEGLHSLRDMLESMSWRYVIFYLRVKSSYLKQDLKTAVVMIPENRRQLYTEVANQLIDDMAEFDYYVRTPKVYESYIYYEKTLKSLDNLVALLA